MSNKPGTRGVDDLALLALSAMLTAPMVAQMVAAWFGSSWHLSAIVQAAARDARAVRGRRALLPRRLEGGAPGSGNMDLLVALGTTAAYGFSLCLMTTLGLRRRHVGKLYFEGSAVVITWCWSASGWRARAKRGTTAAIRELMDAAAADGARIARDGTSGKCRSSRCGRRLVIVRPGERVPGRRRRHRRRHRGRRVAAHRREPASGQAAGRAR